MTGKLQNEFFNCNYIVMFIDSTIIEKNAKKEKNCKMVVVKVLFGYYITFYHTACVMGYVSTKLK